MVAAVSATALSPAYARPIPAMLCSWMKNAAPSACRASDAIARPTIPPTSHRRCIPASSLRGRRVTEATAESRSRAICQLVQRARTGRRRMPRSNAELEARLRLSSDRAGGPAGGVVDVALDPVDLRVERERGRGRSGHRVALREHALVHAAARGLPDTGP